MIPRRPAFALAAIVLISCATAREHWGDEEESPPAGQTAVTSSPKSSAPSQSFVATDTDEAGAAEAPADDGADAGTQPKSKGHHPIPMTVAVVGDDEGANAKRMTSADGVPLHQTPPPVEKSSIAVPEPSTEPEKLPVPEETSKSKKKKKKHAKDEPAAPDAAPAQSVVVDSAAASSGDTKPAPKRSNKVTTVDDDADDDSSPQAADAEQPAHGDNTAEPESHARPTPPREGAGLSILVGVGGLFAHNASSNFTGTFAYGGQIIWSPAFASDFAIDLGFWRAGAVTGNSFESVTSSQSAFDGRLSYLPRFGPGLYAGGGLGAVVTFQTAQYALAAPANSQGNVTSGASFGGDASAAFGYRVSYFEARLDFHLILPGTLRLEMLPTVTVGVTF